MLIANLKRSALGLPTRDPMVLITKTLISAAIVVGSCVVGAAPASADPNSPANQPNPFSALSCSCQKIASARRQALGEQVDRGIRDGLSAIPGDRN
jgi:hypothetical protein